MKRYLILLLCAALLTVTLGGCSRAGGQEVALFQRDERITSGGGTVTASETDPAATEETASAEDGTEKTEADTTTEPETTTEAPETEPESTTAHAGAASGVTSKGYPIVEINGITYVDGLLVANKTYSLPASYNPGALTAETSAAFERMRTAAAEDGITLYIQSGFRSYDLQQSLYNRYVSQDGQAAADRYSARPGHSEHQSGFAMDLNDISYAFADTPAGKWVAANCYKYGFILRYPQDKEAQTGYRYEPWHVRYVGVDAATKIFNSGLCFEEYYGITSQYN